MATAEQVKALLTSHIEGDDTRFYATAMQVAAAEAKHGHGKSAAEIRKLIDKARSGNPVSAALQSPTLIVRPNRELSDLLTASYPKTRLADMILEAGLRARLERVLKEQSNFEKLKAHNLSPRRKLLFTGPPGCGKTMAASALAGELGTPLFVVRLDGLITKFMGESITKLRVIFDALQNTRGVYLFDEFDSIGTHRGFINDVGEIKRVLNSFLMFIEQDASNSLIIAATNHPQSLDYALFRRFDDLLEFALPGPDLTITALKNRLCGFAKSPLDYDQLGQAAQGLSFADITLACVEAVKDAVIYNRKTLTTQEVLAPLAERATFHKRYGGKGE